MADDKTSIVEAHRRLLEGVAYRMLGSLAGAQDVVQDTYLRWRRALLPEIADPRAWLVTTCSRLALDALKSARARRESYVGVWLPEPFIDGRAADPAAQAQVDDTVSVALMLALGKLSPAERAAFILHEVFALSFGEVAAIVQRSEAACRKLASRARVAVRAGKPRFRASPEEHRRPLDAFLKAAYAGELDRLKSVLAGSVELHSDGGGKVEAAVQVLSGAQTVAPFLVAVLHERPGARAAALIAERWFNGAPGVLICEHGRLATAMTIAAESGAIQRIYAVRNPDKLSAFSRPPARFR